ncbi:Palmitoyltransferase PFA4 [Fusarium oxysporum f. sp. albedinis]|nr:Palmitoyltransferase PFA4 [Fusarium oxysporum f. sp. albedinis]
MFKPPSSSVVTFLEPAQYRLLYVIPWRLFLLAFLIFLSHLQNDKPSSRTLGCLFELTEGEKKPANQGPDDALIFLEDGDEVVISAWEKGVLWDWGV